MKINKEKIKKLIDHDVSSKKKEKMRQSVKYYEYEHDILGYRLFYTDNEGQLREETNRSNIKIAHPFFTELVDQKTDYLLSNGVEITSDDEDLKEILKGYINVQFQQVLRKAIEGASIKSKEYVYAYYNKFDQLKFQIADALKVIPIYDDHMEISSLIRYYEDEVEQDNKTIKIKKVQHWTDDDATYYIIKDNQIELDSSQKPNPKKHRTIINLDTKELYGKGFGRLPFFELKNNDKGKTDLDPIKALIDDYDLMACSLSNNLVDFDYPIIAVKGYPTTNLDTLVNNLKTRKTVGTSADGGIDVKTVDIPVNARKIKLEVDEKAIYRFGRGFDSTQIGEGNITNVVIRSRYSLLDLKCNKAEAYLKELINWMLELILKDIQDKHKLTYKITDLNIDITRSIMVNDKDVVDIEKVEADTKKVLIDIILDVAPKLDDDTVLAEICRTLDLDFEDVRKQLAEQDYPIGLHKASELDEMSEPDE